MNDLLCAGKCKLTIKDMMEMPRYFYNDDFNLLLKLSKKGMPVKGLTNLRLDERYIYERYDDPLTGESVFKWKPLST